MGGTDKSYDKLYESVKSQNSLLFDKITDDKANYSTDSQKAKYQSVNITFYYAINQILWWLYYVIVLGVIYCLTFGRGQEYSIKFRLFLVVCAIIYPYVIIPIEIFLYWLLGYFYSVINQTVYYKPTFDMPSFTLTSYT